jgi:hypothetical protein
MPDPAVVEEPKPSPPATPVVTEEPQPSAGAEVETQPEPSAEGGKPPEKGGVQRRIDELTKARRLAEAEAEFWRQKALGTAPGDKSPTTAADKPKAKPNPADFETTEAYLEARDAWVLEEADRRRDAKLQEELSRRDQAYEQRSEQEILSAEWADREEATKEKNPDYEEVTAQAMDALQSSKGPAVAAIAHAVQYSEMGPQVLYYLGQHPEEIGKLAGLHPTQAVIALGRIEARLAAETEGGDKAPPQTRAPKPPTPVRKVAPHDDGELRDDLSPEEWRARFLKKREKK